MPKDDPHPIVIWARGNRVSSMSVEFDATGQITSLDLVFDPKDPDVFDEFEDMQKEQRHLI